MAFSEAPTGRPRGGEVVKVGGPARARAIELKVSRIADGSRERNTRPLATAVFDF